MAIITNKATLNGVTNFTLKGQVYDWSDTHFLSSVDVWGTDGPDTNIFELKLTNDFHLRMLSISGDNGKAAITDLNDGGNREIEFLRLGGLGGSVTLTTTYVEMFMALSGLGQVKLSVGAAGMGSVLLDDSNDILTLKGGWIVQASLGGGNNKVTLDKGQISSLYAFEGNDTLTLGRQSRVDQADLGDGTNTVVLAAGTRINSLHAGEDVNNVTLQGDARIYMIKLESGVNTLTTDKGNVESYYCYDGDNTLNIGAGGIQQIVLSGNGVQTVTALGFVGSLQVYDESSSTVTINGSAINVFTGKGDDHVTLAAGEWIGRVATWDGNDVVSMGAGATIESCNLENGDDTFRFNTFLVKEFGMMRGGDGMDLADFSQITTGLSISMNLNGALQALGAGQVGLVEFENLMGGAGADRLEGDAFANRIDGAGGADRIFGLDGADVLAGGGGNDTLAGGAGADQFEFSAGGGRDRVTDFALGSDVIHFTNADALADITFAKQGTGVLLTVGAVSVLVDNVTVAQMQVADNFTF